MDWTSYSSALGRRFLTRVCINDLTLNWRLFSDILSCWKTYKKDMISSQSKELSFLFTIDARWWSSTWFSCWSVILSSWILWWLKVYIISELLWIVKFHLSVAFEIIRKRSDRDTDHWRTALCYRDHPRKSNSFLHIIYLCNNVPLPGLIRLLHTSSLSTAPEET